LRCEFGLQMAEFGTYPLGQQFRYRRGNEPCSPNAMPEWLLPHTRRCFAKNVRLE
jgi:hypothetical protein